MLPIEPADVRKYEKRRKDAAVAPTPEIMACLHSVCRDKAANFNEIYSLATQTYCSSLGLLLIGIDPATGDSAAHTATAASNLKVLHHIYEKSLGTRPFQETPYCMLMWIKNLTGNTILHVAERTGDKEVVKYVYRLFCHEWDRPGYIRDPPAEESGAWKQLDDDYDVDEHNVPRIKF